MSNGINIQRLELLEAQCKDFKEREESLKLLNNSIMTALNELASEAEKNTKKQVAKETDILIKKHELELKELKSCLELKIKILENCNVDLLGKNEELNKNLENQKEDFENKLEHSNKKIKELSIENERLSHSLRFLEEENRNSKEIMLSENKLKLNDMSHEIEKINLIFEKDKKNLENNCQAQITSLQASHDKEIQGFLSKIKDFQHEKELLVKSNDQNLYLYEDLKQKLYDQINVLKIQKELDIKEIDTLKQNIKKIEENFKEKEKNLNKELLQIKEMNRAELEENKRLRTKLLLNQNTIKTLEKSEKSYKILLHEKDLMVDAEKTELKKLLVFEKIKSDRMTKLASEIKEEFSRKHALIIQESLNKEESIKKLTANLLRISAKASRKESKSPISRENQGVFNETTIKTKKLSNLSLLKTDYLSTQEKDALTQRNFEEKMIISENHENLSKYHENNENTENIDKYHENEEKFEEIDENEEKELNMKKRTKSYSACCSNKIVDKKKSVFMGVGLEENNMNIIEKQLVMKKIDKLDKKRYESKLRVIRKGSYFEKENQGGFSLSSNSNQLEKTYSMKNVINSDFKNKTSVFLKNL